MQHKNYLGSRKIPARKALLSYKNFSLAFIHWRKDLENAVLIKFVSDLHFNQTP